MKKRSLVLLLVAVLMVGQSSMIVSAHGHYRGTGRGQVIRYTVCNVEGCNTMWLHNHNGVSYYGHNYNDGHDYHELCNVEGCTKTGVHEHDGIQCMPHSTYDGHEYHNTRSHIGHH